MYRTRIIYTQTHTNMSAHASIQFFVSVWVKSKSIKSCWCAFFSLLCCHKKRNAKWIQLHTIHYSAHNIKWKLNMKINMKHAIKIIAAYACVFRHHGCLLRPLALYEFRIEPKTEYCLCECILIILNGVCHRRIRILSPFTKHLVDDAITAHCRFEQRIQFINRNINSINRIIFIVHIVFVA